MSLLEIKGLTMRFGGLTAVNKLDLSLNRGEILSIIGPNGAGKTTVFNAITGIYEPTAGEVLLLGRDTRRPFNLKVIAFMFFVGLFVSLMLYVSLHLETLWQLVVIDGYEYLKPFDYAKAFNAFMDYIKFEFGGASLAWSVSAFCVGAGGAFAIWKRSRRIPHLMAENGIIRTFQNIRLFQEMTVLENVLIGMETTLKTRLWHMLFRLPFYWTEKKTSLGFALKLLKFVDLDEHAYHIAKNLSYGDQRRVEIARALASSPQILLLDEPAAGMNPIETADLMHLIHKIRDEGISILLIEHHMRLVMGISDKIIVLDYGNKIAEGTPQAVKQNPRVIEAYLGKEEEP